ncbi:hypothetical protein [Shimazuella alba]|uniref:Uncharacterized protein n=1 Tax=Shimazuella alba TaxID=2690964 RepID=A0A6I4VWE2_9BACL|nr:hypothetical protein [Shimazuella alba]MXQ54405.1 hypothetical protein [Shimazuella alba]
MLNKGVDVSTAKVRATINDQDTTVLFEGVAFDSDQILLNLQNGEVMDLGTPGANKIVDLVVEASIVNFNCPNWKDVVITKESKGGKH